MVSVLARGGDAGGAVDLAATPDFSLGALTVRPAVREVCAVDAVEVLEPRVMQVLVALSEERDHVVSRERLIDRCWGGRIVSEDAINNCISKVRRVGDGYGAFSIQTVPRVGYRLSAKPKPKLKPPKVDRLWRRSPQIGLAGGIVAALFVFAMAGAMAWTERQPSVFTVAVVPFDAAAGDPASEALAKRVDDTLTSAMTGRHVDVVPNPLREPTSILVRGAVETHGREARVRLTLEDRRANLVIWQGRFEGDGGFDSDLPDQVAAKATSMVTTARELYDSSRGKAKPKALKAYVLGMENYRERHNLTEHLRFIRSMRETDPGIPLVHAIYAQMLTVAAGEQPQIIGQDWSRQAAAEADEAIRLDRNIGLAYAAKANAMEPLEFGGRLAVMERGLRFAPLDGHLSAYYGLLKADVGRGREGMPFTRRGHLTDPDAAPRAYAAIDQMISVGLSQEARQNLLEARRLFPNNFRNPLSMTLLAVAAQGPQEGAATIEQVHSAYPDADSDRLWLDFFDSLRCRRHGEATAGRITEAALSGRAGLAPAYLSLSRLGYIDRAFQVASLVKYAPATNDYRMLFSPAAAPMRRQPRFMTLAAHLGLAQYWAASGQWPEFCAEPGLPYDCKSEAARAMGAAPSPWR